MFGIPYSSISWFTGFIAVYLFSFKSFLAYKKSGNPIALMYFWLSLAFGTAFLMYSLPTFFTLEPSKLMPTYFIGDSFLQLGLQFQVWLLWFIGLRSRISLFKLYCFTVPFSVVTIFIEIFTSHDRISFNPLMIIFLDIPAVLILKDILYIFICWPLGYFFITQAWNQKNLRSKITSIATGLVFIVVSSAAVLNSITAGGSDTYSSSLLDTGIFGAFIIINLIPKKIISFEHKLKASKA